jgi:hypothetical protein
VFAGDQVILTSDDDTMHWRVFELYKIAKKFNLIISKQKATVTALYRKRPIRSKIIFGDQTNQQVNTFNFLGCHISYIGETDITQKIAKFNYIRVGLFWEHWKIKQDLIHKVNSMTMALLTGLYQSETWVISTSNRRRLQGVEMHFLSSVAALTQQNRIRNKIIWKNLMYKASSITMMNIALTGWVTYKDGSKWLRKIITEYKPKGKNALEDLERDGEAKMWSYSRFKSLYILIENNNNFLNRMGLGHMLQMQSWIAQWEFWQQSIV